MNSFVGSIALIRHPEQLERQWLAHWDRSAEQYEFVTAERLEQESWRECLDREIAWSLNLRRGKDYIMSSAARLHFEAQLPVPGNEEETVFVVEFYVTDLYGGAALGVLDRNPDTCWLSGHELLSGVTAEGKSVAPILVMLLTKADIIKRHTN